MKFMAPMSDEETSGLRRLRHYVLPGMAPALRAQVAIQESLTPVPMPQGRKS
jgi:hypothetical protein